MPRGSANCSASPRTECDGSRRHQVRPDIGANAGLKVVGGTDSTRIGEFNTWQAIEYHITGRAIGGGFQRRADMALTREQALRLYTSSAAWVTSDENSRGTIQTGMLADFAVLD